MQKLMVTSLATFEFTDVALAAFYCYVSRTKAFETTWVVFNDFGSLFDW